MFNSIYLQRSWLEDHLKKQIKSTNKVINKLEYNSDINVSSLDDYEKKSIMNMATFF